MDVWDPSKLAIFLAFVTPGFIALKVYDLLSPAARGTTAERLIDAMVYSAINYSLLAWPLLWIKDEKLWETNRGLFAVLLLFGVFVVPVVWTLAWHVFRSRKCVQRFFPHPTGSAWDYFFSLRQPGWVIVQMKTGRKVAGLYGGDSFASSAPNPRELFLQEAWLLNDDGGFERVVNESAGVIVCGEVESIEVFQYSRNEETCDGEAARSGSREPRIPASCDGSDGEPQDDSGRLSTISKPNPSA